MKRILKTSSFLILLFCCIVQVNAQQSKDLKRNGVIKNIQFEKTQQPAIQEAQNILKQKLKMNDSDRFILLKKTNDDLGFSHERYQQYHQGVKVEFGTYIVHSKNNKIQTMNGDFFPLKSINTNPTISEKQALNIALENINAESYMWESKENDPDGTYKPAGELVVVKQFYAKDKTPDLAYKFDIYAANPISRDHVYVNAHTGKVVFKNAIIKHCFHGAGEHTSICSANHNHNKKSEAINKAARTVADFFATGTAATRYSGSRSIETSTTSGGYRLRDNTRGGGINTFDCNTGTSYNNAVDFVDNNNSWTSGEWNNAQKDNAALDAHWGAEMTYDYFVQQHNRNSYDGNGAAINSYVHYNSNYDNAFWDGSRMTYGDGNTFDALTSLDVAAHEIGHGVCSYTANLVYSYESGALNEAFSDIWAACVEDLMTTGKQPFLIGEDIGPNGNPLRSMSNPNSQNQPDTYLGTSWYSGSGDNGGVHYNSGVLNHCFYILSEGKSGSNDNGDSYSVDAIGIVKAGKIFYRAESVYLSANSQYADARTACIQSAIDLYGANSTEVCQTTNAFYAVGVGAASSCSTGSSCSDGIQNGNETGVDCGGSCSPCSTACTGSEVVITLTFDNYPEETSWSLKSGNTTVASGGTYGNQADGSTLTITECLADGCYDFTITDVYGDGICCSYGSGSYTITSGGTTLASGGSFGSSETKEICLNGTPDVPGCTDRNAHNYDADATVDDGSCETCDDGIQNGDETAVDCGGSKCAPCPCQDIQISITFDNYPEETSWTLSSGGTTVAAGGTYANQADGSTINLTGCLALACYEFTITDAYGDGICCSYGNGSYTISAGGNTLASGGSFGSSETKSFCLTNSVTSSFAGGIQNTTQAKELNDAIANEISIFPNPAKDILNVSFSADSKEISIDVYNQLGQVVKTQNVAGGTKNTQLQIADLTPGNYFINVTVDGVRTVQKFVKY